MASRFCVRLITVVIVFCFFSTVSAEFKIEDYIHKNFEDNQLYLDGNFYIQDNNYNNETDNSPTDLFTRDDDNSSFSFNSGFDANYRYIYQTKDRFLDFGMYLEPRLRLSNNDNSFYGTDEIDLLFYNKNEHHNDFERYTFNLSPKIEAGEYIIDDFFASLVSSFSFNYDYEPSQESEAVSDVRYFYYYNDVNMTNTYRQDMQDNNSSGYMDSKSYNLKMKVLPGWGHIYEGSFASTAIYLIDELRRASLLKKEPSDEQMKMLTELVYNLRQELYIDSRLYRIESFEKLFDFFTEQGLVDSISNFGYLTIADVWDYFPRDNRPFGLKISIGPGIDYRYSSSQQSSKGHSEEQRYENIYDLDDNLIDRNTLDDEITDYKTYQSRYYEDKDVYLLGRIEYEKPLSRQWQFSGYFDYLLYLDSYHIRKNTQDNYYVTNGTPSHTAGSSYSKRDLDDREAFYLGGTVRYYYDSRTRLSMMFELAHNNYLDIDYISSVNSDTVDYSRWEGNFAAGLEYRISIPTTLNVSLRYYKGRTEYGYNDAPVVSNERNMSLNASIRHFLF